MISILSLVTSVKDYVEIVHKLIESDSNYKITNYDDLGPIITYMVITLKEFIFNVISLNWLKSIWAGSLPIIIPEISSAMVSEISVLDGYFHNAFNFLDTSLSYGETNIAIYSLEKFTIGLINSLFLFIPTGTSHLITLRRFVMQGLEAGYLAGLGSICGNLLWITSVIFGWRFFVIPWLSLDIFRYLLGFVILVKYMWDSYNEKRSVITTTPAKQKIFLLNFLLALTEQTSIYPFISNISIGSESSILESFPAQNWSEFVTIHGCYIMGLTLGCLSLLHLTCWFWENPAFKIYMWIIASPKFKVSTSFYYKVLNFTFLYLTMICAISSIPYYGLDYTVTNPLGFVQDDRIVDKKVINGLSFLNSKASDRNTRRNRGRHGRRERWKRRIRKYRTFDASLYDQGIYDLFTIEDLNYGFDRFWLRRKLRNHTIRFRFFPGPWMRSFKKELAKTRLESYSGPRQEFFRILFEQVYHPSFHEYSTSNKITTLLKDTALPASPTPPARGAPVRGLGVGVSKKESQWETKWETNLALNDKPLFLAPKKELSIYLNTLGTINNNSNVKENLKLENSTLRKFVRKINNRIKSSEIKNNFKNPNLGGYNEAINNWGNLSTSQVGLSPMDLSGRGPNKVVNLDKNLFYSKRWKQIFSKISHPKSRTDFGPGGYAEDNKEQLTTNNGQLKGLLRNFYQASLTDQPSQGHALLGAGMTWDGSYDVLNIGNFRGTLNMKKNLALNRETNKKQNSKINLAKKDQQILKYRSIFLNKDLNNKALKTPALNSPRTTQSNNTVTLLHPLKFYLKKQQAFERKLRYYTPTIFRKFAIENNAPYFRVMMKRYFYYYKPTLRWERTMKVGSLRKARRKTLETPRKIQFSDNSLRSLSSNSTPNYIAQKDGTNIVNTRFTKVDANISNRMVKPTQNYTIVGKRASRYRYQIYKDVLQHWYYSPFNRLLLKFDIDLFIKRQPNSHFLTKNEEKLLHLRRFLLSEHYNTLRWYTYMQHYRSMKTKIGGTKSFASGTYNQQFSGTFKKIRHLFAITPSQNSQTVLKFDQPLYNEYYNNSKNSPLGNQKNFIIHEELLIDQTNGDNKNGDPLGKDLLNQSTQVIRNYLIKTNPIKQDYIKNLIEQKNYIELTQFLYKGKKTRGLVPATNEKSFLSQEKEYLLTSIEKEEFKNLEKIKLEKFLRPLQQDLWINFLKKWKRKINNQKFLKNYVNLRVTEHLKIQKEKIDVLKTKLNLLESLFSLNNKDHSSAFPPPHKMGSVGKGRNATYLTDVEKTEVLTNLYNYAVGPSGGAVSTGIQKALSEGISILNNNTKYTDTAREKVNAKYLKKASPLSLSKRETNSDYLSKNLIEASILKKEKQLYFSLNNLSKIVMRQKSFGTIDKDNLALKPLNLKQISYRIKNIFKKYTFYSSKKIKLINILKSIRQKSLQDWEQKDHFYSKKKRVRKKFQTFIKQTFKDNLNALEHEPPLSLSKRDTNSKQKEVQLVTIAKQLTSEGSPERHLVSLKERLSSQSEFKTEKRDYSNKLNQLLENNASTKAEPKIQTEGLETLVSLKKSNWKKRIKNKYIQTFLKKNDWRKEIKKTYMKYFTIKFKRKKSPQRRARFWKINTLIRKHKISDPLISELKGNTGLLRNKELSPDAIYQKGNLERRSKQQKHRVWKQKKSKIDQDIWKSRKRRRSTLAKVRILNKQFKRIQSTTDLKNWWWKNFLPNFRATTDSLWQYEKDRQILQKLLELSIPEILERDKLTYQLNGESKIADALQIGDFDYKPLAIPEAIRLRENLLNEKDFFTGKENNSQYQTQINPEINFKNNDLNTPGGNVFEEIKNDSDIVSRVAKTSLLSDNQNYNLVDNQNKSKQIVITSPIPFYAGWDESLRKFVVTNRLLSRRDSGYEMRMQQKHQKDLKFLLNLEPSQNILSFTAAPLKGMNAATTLYWQIPFTTYDPDQFFALGMDGFAPLGWRRFQFRHSILKSWLYEKTTPLSFSFRETKHLGNVQDTLGIIKKTNPGRETQNRYIVKNKANIIQTLQPQLNNGNNKANAKNFNNKQLVYKLKEKNNIINDNPFSPEAIALWTNGAPDNLSGNKNKFITMSNKNIRNINRHLKKRYERVKKHPRTPAWFPSGPLLNQVLPVHYIYIFYKQSRLPRDRYIKRLLRKSNATLLKDTAPTAPPSRGVGVEGGSRETETQYLTLNNNNLLRSQIPDFTLRKRIKTQRKYHIKQDLNKKSPIIPRRMKFIGEDSTVMRWRPLSRQKLNKPIAELIKEQRALKYKQRKKEQQDASTKQPANLRLKQLRRRVQRQIIRPIWRYQPRAGGFVWPGDYLKLELVKVPKLNTKNISTITTEIKSKENNKLRSGPIKIKRKKKRSNIQEWQMQPKKYLLQKHNYNVIKKKLEKAQRSNKIRERIKELSLTL